MKRIYVLAAVLAAAYGCSSTSAGSSSGAAASTACENTPAALSCPAGPCALVNAVDMGCLDAAAGPELDVSFVALAKGPGEQVFVAIPAVAGPTQAIQPARFVTVDFSGPSHFETVLQGQERVVSDSAGQPVLLGGVDRDVGGGGHVRDASVARRQPDGTWPVERVLDGQRTGPMYAKAAAVARDGTLHVAYSFNTVTTGSVLLASRTPQGMWSTKGLGGLEAIGLSLDPADAPRLLTREADNGLCLLREWRSDGVDQRVFDGLQCPPLFVRLPAEGRYLFGDAPELGDVPATGGTHLALSDASEVDLGMVEPAPQPAAPSTCPPDKFCSVSCRSTNAEIHGRTLLTTDDGSIWLATMTLVTDEDLVFDSTVVPPSPSDQGHHPPPPGPVHCGLTVTADRSTGILSVAKVETNPLHVTKRWSLPIPKDTFWELLPQSASRGQELLLLMRKGTGGLRLIELDTSRIP